LTYEQSNTIAQLSLIVASSLQREIDAVLNRLRSSLGAKKDDNAHFSSDLKDLFGVSIRKILDMPFSTENPLIVVVKGTSSSSSPNYDKSRLQSTFTEESYRSLVENAQSFSSRVLAIDFDTISHVQQLYLIAKTDILIGAHSSALSHILWSRRGSGVLEIFPHWEQKDANSGAITSEGTGWTNDIAFLTQIKGSIYRAIDSSQGSQSPINHKISDSHHQLYVDNIKLNMTAVQTELSSLVTRWKWLRLEEKSGKDIDMTKHWHPEWRPWLKLNGQVT